MDLVLVDVYPTLGGVAVNDLSQADFEVLEDGVPQRIASFESITIRRPGAEAERRTDPRTVAESNDAAADPRRRLFVLFLDTYHSAPDRRPDGTVLGKTPTARERAAAEATPPASAGRTTRALEDLLGHLIGPDDLVGLLTPEMRVDALSFTNGTQAITEFLEKTPWQRLGDGTEVAGTGKDLDAQEAMYRACYPTQGEDWLVAEMIERRRQVAVLDALRNLVRHLEMVRDERKAVLLVSRGWTLFGPNVRLAAAGSAPAPPAIGVQGGQLRLGASRSQNDQAACDRDRAQLADLETRRQFREILQEAVRANVTFYPIDPSGLRAKTSLAAAKAIDGQNETLQVLASSTGGLAVVDTNDIQGQARRIVDDLSSYYLLGYSSSNTRHDGTFRKITVRVKRQGVVVRARSGYRALSEAEIEARSAATSSVDSVDAARTRALVVLSQMRDGRTIHLTAGSDWRPAEPDGDSRAGLWVALEAVPPSGERAQWAGGRDVSVQVMRGAQVVATSRARLSTRAPRALVRLPDALPPGDYVLTTSVADEGGAASRTTDQVRVTLPPPPSAGACGLATPLLFRRGPFTGRDLQATADYRFRRAEQMRLEIPVARPAVASVRLLDRRGAPLAVPVVADQRPGHPGTTVVADLALAPLGPADYLLETTVRCGDREERNILAFRIVP